MALFLTRTLAADGVLPPAGLQVTITPADDVTLASGNARAYTITFKNADGTPYTGFVSLWIVDVNASNAAIVSPIDPAENVDWQLGTLSDSLSGGGSPFAFGFAGTDGVVTGVIRHDGLAAEKVRVYAIRDADADGLADTGEPTATSGLTTFSGVPVAEADDGVDVVVDVVSTTLASDSFIAGRAAVDCGNGAGSDCLFNYDSGDLFLIGGVGTDLAGFEAALNAGDEVTVTNYADSQGGQSTFDISNDVDPAVTITAPPACLPAGTLEPCSGATVDALTFNVTGTAVPGYTVRIYADFDDDEALDAGEPLVGTTVAAADGTWSIPVPLIQESTNHFIATQRPTPAGADQTPYVNVPSITETASLAASLDDADGTNGGILNILDSGDTVILDFNEAMSSDFTGDSLQVSDGVDVVTLTNGLNASFAVGADSSIVVITVTTPLGVTVNAPATVQNLNGFVGADGLAVNVNTDPDRLIDVPGF
jgi:hypothetical protein